MSHDERDLLVRELRDRSRDVGGHPIELDDVRASAQRIRWRRRAVGAAVAAVVVAIAVPVGLGATGTLTAGNPPIATRTSSPPAPPSPSRSVATTPSPTVKSSPKQPTQPAGTIPLTTVGLPAGAPPAIGYLLGRTLHRPDGGIQQVGEYFSLTPYHGGWLATGPAHGEMSVVTIDAQGKVIDTQPGSDRLTVSQDGTSTAWVTTSSNGQRAAVNRGIPSGMSNGTATQAVPGVQAGVPVTPVGFVAGGSVVYTVGGGNPSVRVTDFGGHDRALPGLINARGTSETDDLVAGQTSSSNSGSCWEVRDVSSGARVWGTCKFALGQFSQDGKYVYGTDAYGDGAGSGTVAILDAHTGKVLADFVHVGGPDDQLAVSDLAWEYADTLLGVVSEKGSWHILRFTPGGKLELLVGPMHQGLPPFHFVARP
ncbi:MAG: hypothetical protein ACRDPB_00690 [Nocardioidaceae bacterium]